jgi:hypothetical protein
MDQLALSAQQISAYPTLPAMSPSGSMNSLVMTPTFQPPFILARDNLVRPWKICRG